jgi:Mg2+-importing ATPase
MFIRRFMSFFGPISSVYDFLTFGVMLWVFHAGAHLFQTGWFVESLATQSLVIFVIRTRRVPFTRSRPSRPLLVATVSCAGLGVLLPFIPPVAHTFAFRPLPAAFLGILLLMIATYLLLVEVGKRRFFRLERARALAVRLPPQHRRIRRLVTRWSHPDPRVMKQGRYEEPG